MKNPERVAVLIAELRTLAETDFERHRIDVLERDLTAPPTVEVVDDTHQRFNGEIFTNDKTGHCFRRQSIHREVWAYYHGEIPAEHDIHHVDGNKSNNVVENLQCMPKSQHMKLHKSAEQSVENVCHYCGKTFFSKARKSFCSEMCYIKSRGTVKQCKFCGNDFLAVRDEQDFCSHKCAAAWNNQTQKQMERTCRGCGRKFTGRIGDFCSNKCYQHFRYHNDTVEKTCVVCGKTFTASKHSQSKTCSYSCSGKLSHSKKAK